MKYQAIKLTSMRLLCMQSQGSQADMSEQQNKMTEIFWRMPAARQYSSHSTFTDLWLLDFTPVNVASYVSHDQMPSANLMAPLRLCFSSKMAINTQFRRRKSGWAVQYWLSWSASISPDAEPHSQRIHPKKFFHKCGVMASANLGQLITISMIIYGPICGKNSFIHGPWTMDRLVKRENQGSPGKNRIAESVGTVHLNYFAIFLQMFKRAKIQISRDGYFHALNLQERVIILDYMHNSLPFSKVVHEHLTLVNRHSLWSRQRRAYLAHPCYDEKGSSMLQIWKISKSTARLCRTGTTAGVRGS